MRRMTLIRASLAAAAATALVVAVPLAASAHVRVNPDQATPGSYAQLTFRVPTESATAGTVKLVVDLPTDHPLGSVSYQPLAGWTTEVTTEKLAKPITTDDGTVTEAPTRITWTADPGVQIAPGEFDQFQIVAGPIPDTGSLLLPAHQTYSDGSVVDWDQKAPASGDEPEHPAPTLYIDDAPPADESASSTAVSTASAEPVAAAASRSTDSGLVTAAIAVGIAGLVLGAVSLIVAVVALMRRPRSTQAP